MADHVETIFALASGTGPAGVAVIRLSGAGAGMAVEKMTRRPLPEPRTLRLRTLYGKTNGDHLDDALVVCFPAPRSYTGEDVVEIHCHGGRAVLERVLAELGRQPGLRLAEAGEFTRRAVENGRMDLLQAEALCDLVLAQTEAQRRQALQQLEGRLSDLYEGWRQRLVKAAAWLEAAIDFADEDLPPSTVAASRTELASLREEMATHLSDGSRGEILREGLHVAVIGPPNAGKSSLVNALARRDVAIVSEVAGTTRDVLEVGLNLGGYPVLLADTAGLREARDTIEQEGVRRARERARRAHARVLVLDGTRPDAPREMETAEIVVWNKADLVPVSQRQGAGLWVSALSGEGLPELVRALAEWARKGLSGEAPALTRARHREAVAAALQALEGALATGAEQHELAAEHVRRALVELGRLTGRVDLEELLDVVFRDFCIGK